MKQSKRSIEIVINVYGGQVSNIGNQVQVQENSLTTNNLGQQNIQQNEASATASNPAEEASDETSFPANSKQPASSCQEEGGALAATPKRRGGKVRKLFKSGDFARKEKERLLSFLSQHHLGGRFLSCERGDRLIEVVVCFVVAWRERKLLAYDDPSGGSIFRFLTDDCNLKTRVELRSFANKIKLFLAEKVYKPTTMQQVRLCF